MPETTPRINPNARLSRWARNRLPCPHSCISTKMRKLNKLISNTTAAVIQRETARLDTAPHQSSARPANAVRTCVNALTLSGLACRRMMAPRCSFRRRTDGPGDAGCALSETFILTHASTTRTSARTRTPGPHSIQKPSDPAGAYRHGFSHQQPISSGGIFFLETKTN
jgi:hypothetical protein